MMGGAGEAGAAEGGAGKAVAAGGGEGEDAGAAGGGEGNSVARVGAAGAGQAAVMQGARLVTVACGVCATWLTVCTTACTTRRPRGLGGTAALTTSPTGTA